MRPVTRYPRSTFPQFLFQLAGPALAALVILGAVGAQAQPSAPAASPAASRAADAQAPDPIYLQRDRQVKVFDESQSAKLNPIRQAAEELLQRELGRQVRPPMVEPGLLTYSYQLEGDSEEEILAEARVLALQSAAGRLYFDDYFLIGRELLEKYLRVHGNRFIVRTDVTGRRILANNRREMRLKLSVDVNAFYTDLSEKRFIAEPNLRPLIAVHLRETGVGGEAMAGQGRQRVEQTMHGYLIRARTRDMRHPPATADLSESPEQLLEARLEAQRHSVDVLITGALDVRAVQQGPILYDEYFFQEADLKLSMYRVDTGELITEVSDRYSASGGSVEEATQKVLDALVSRSTRRLAERLGTVWNYTMLDRADYRLMFSGLDAGRRPNVINDLRRLSPDVQIFEKSYYGGVWVVNVVLPADAPGRMETFLRESTEPQFLIEKIDDRHFRLEVL
jgi:hypothetical protein